MALLIFFSPTRSKSFNFSLSFFLCTPPSNHYELLLACLIRLCLTPLGQARHFIEACGM
jgi:hypothetical protein